MGVKNCIANYCHTKKVTFKIKVGTSAQNRKYIKKYKAFLTKKNLLHWQYASDLKLYLKKVVVK